MSFPIVVIYGHKVETDDLGWIADFCPRCNKVQPFSIYEKIRTDHIYFIDVSKREIGKILTCDFCETSYAAPRGTVLKTDLHWRKEHGFPSLVTRTNPTFGIIPHFSSPTASEMEALLLSIRERGKFYDRDVKGGIILGGFAGASTMAIIGGLLGLLGMIFGPDIFGQIVLSVFLGGIIGAIVGAIYDSRGQSIKAISNGLEYFMYKHNISVHSLQSAIKRSQQDFSKIEKVMEMGYGQFFSTVTHLPQGVSTAGVAYQNASVNQSGNVVCSQCNLTNFSYNTNCRRCGAAVNSPR
jgi:hypothetical protein